MASVSEGLKIMSLSPGGGQLFFAQKGFFRQLLGREW